MTSQKDSSAEGRTQHVSLSHLRQCNTRTLRRFNDAKDIAILHHHAKPVAVLSSYKRFVELQELVRMMREEAQ